MTTLTRREDKAQISMVEVGEPTHGYTERLMRTIKEEEVDLSEHRDSHDVYQHIGSFIEDVYMHKQVHSTLVYLAPTEFERQWLTLPVNERATPERGGHLVHGWSRRVDEWGVGDLFLLAYRWLLGCACPRKPTFMILSKE